MTNGLILEFRPWIWARTTVYEYYCMSWATRVASERTRHAPLAARLVGESFELAVKVLQILTQGPAKELKFGHKLSALLGAVPVMASILRELWGNDLDYVIDIMDGECDPSQVRYGAAGGLANKGDRVIPSGYAATPEVWTSTTLELYEELMSTLGQTIWSNYPEGDRNGRPVKRRIEIRLAKTGPDGPAEVTLEEEAALQKDRNDPTIWAYLLRATNEENAAPDIPNWGVIPMDRLNDSAGTTFYVRARISPNMVADVEVTKETHGFSVGSCRLTGHEEGRYKLAIHTALAVMPHRGGPV